MPRVRHLVVAALLAGTLPAPGAAQEPVVPDSVPPDSLAQAQAARDSALTPADPTAPGNCTLEFEPIAPDTRSLSQREEGEAYITYISGRMLWTCGNATMEADSAAKFDLARRVNLVGNVVYRDSIRELTSDLLTYYEIQDLVVAERSVELVRTTDGSTLTGPHVEFLRAVSGIDEVTTAIGRPHMRFYPAPDSAADADSAQVQEPFEIDADRAQFAGESVARMYGDVVILRSDLSAEADSALLTREDGVGILWGDPWVESEEVRLEGDTIRFVSEEEELREVHALGNGFARGEQFEVRADLIDIALEQREVEEVWAYGEGMSEALSGDHRLYGDSLRFRLVASQIDTVYSIGEAVAIQGEAGEPPPAAAIAPDSAGAAPPTPSPELPDSLVAAMPDSLAARVADSLGVGIPDSLLAGADSLRARLPDSLLARLPGPLPPISDSLAAAARDSLAGIADPGAVAAADSTARELMAAILEDVRVTGRDSTRAAAEPGGEGDAARERPSPGPVLAVDGSMNWVRGDTLIAVFERPGRQGAQDSAAAALADSLGFDPGGAEATPEAGVEPGVAPAADSTGVGPDSLAAAGAEPGEAARDTADPRMEQMTVIGNAKAFYRQVRDSAATNRPSRNYMIGRRIVMFFEDGEVAFVRGQNAIGAFLEPEEAVPAAAGGTAGQGPPPGAAPDSTARADTVSVPPDTLATPPDTLATPRDTTGAPGDAVAATPDPTRAVGEAASTETAAVLRARIADRVWGRPGSASAPVERPRPGQRAEDRAWRKR